MPNAFLVIGVGGAGRGVCNHIKYELELQFASLMEARTQILVIDGPPSPSQYVLPGGYDIDTSEGSPEWYQPRLSPEPAISNIARGEIITEQEKYISSWLSKEEAAKIPRPIRPEAGFGGHRTPGHAYIYLDLDNLRQRLQTSYQNTRNILGRATGRGNQVYIFLIGSMSGGTGAGLLWDIAHFLKNLITPNQDVLFSFLPLPNSFHTLCSSEEAKSELDAKNFAGLLNLIRFMYADDTFPATIRYSDNISVHNSQLVGVPFVLDGDRSAAKVNDVKPQLGIAPAIADFILSSIKDNISTGQIFQDLINWPNQIGLASKPDKYATFGTFCLKYPYKETLKSFSYRFAYEIYNDILSPLGESVNKSQILGVTILNSTTFTQMIADPSTVRLRPDEYKLLKDKIRVGRTGDSPPPHIQPLPDVIDYGGIWPFKRKDYEAISDAENHMANMKTQFKNWIERQRPKIDQKFLTDLEDTLKELFTKMEAGKTVSKNLQEDPCSIVVARDFLKYLKERIEGYKTDQDRIKGFEAFIEEEFQRYYYPEGPNKPDIIARQINVVNEKKRAMSANDSDKQEAYLKAATKLLELEVWQILVEGVKTICSDIKRDILRLWNLIGDDAHGWVNNLIQFKDEMDDKYDADITRRNGFRDYRLRTYLPAPDGEAEDKLFEEIAEPEINTLLSQMRWEFAIDPSAPERYRILLHSLQVSGFEYERVERRLINPQTGKPIETYIYSPYEHVQHAINVLEPRLRDLTIWDIMERDFRWEWLPAKKGGQLEEGKRSQYEEEYVEEWVNRLLAGSSMLLNSTQNPAITRAFTLSNFQIATPPKNIATRFYQELETKTENTPGETLESHHLLSQEVRRSVVYLEFPLTAWNYYLFALGNYLKYRQDPNNVLIDIYKNEQNAFHLSNIIKNHIDRNHQLLDISVVSLLNDLDVFRYYVLCYVMGLIDKKEGSSRLAPKIYYLDMPGGQVDLAEEWNIGGLSIAINQIGYTQGGIYRDNSDIQAKLKSLWQKKEDEADRAGQLKDLIEELEKRGRELTFPAFPNPADNNDPLKKRERDHLKLAFRAIICEYVESMKKKLP